MLMKAMRYSLGAAAMSLLSSGAMAAGTIVDVAAGNGNFNTLVAAVKAAGLAETLSGKGTLTRYLRRPTRPSPSCQRARLATLLKDVPS